MGICLTDPHQFWIGLASLLAGAGVCAAILWVWLRKPSP